MFNKLRYSAMLLVLFMFKANLNFAQSGCPGCAVNAGCSANQDVAICPPALPDACFNAPYSEDLTFYIPKSLIFQGQNVTLGSVQLVGIVGVPQGLSWQIDKPGGVYSLSGVNETRGCIRICGTPTTFGTFFITVTVNANVTAPITTTQSQSFSLPLVVKNCGGGNPFFSYNSSEGCDTLTVQYEGTYPAAAPKVTEFEWDYGNGQTGTGKKPAPVFYDQPGVYYPSLQTKYFNLSLDSVVATVTGDWFCGDVEEPNLPIVGCTSSPDPQFFFTSGSKSIKGNSKSDTRNAKWAASELQQNGKPFTLESAAISIRFEDLDAISANDDGGSFTTVLTGPGAIAFTTTAPSGGGVSGTIYFGTKLDTIYTQSDTIKVNALPAATSILALPDTSVCSGDTIFLSVYDGPYRYVWFKNDTSVIPFENESSYFIPADPYILADTVSIIKVQISDTITGCKVVTENVRATLRTPVPLYIAATGVYQSNSTTLTAASGFTYQWLFNGLPISGANSANYTPLVNGPYSCILSNASGCFDTSNVVDFVISGIENLNSFSNLVTLFPNPSKGIMTLYVASSEATELSFDIYNNMGQLIASEKLERAGNSFNKQLDYSSVQAGNYVMHLSMNGQSATKRFVIIK
jgi:hypothetical protein